MPCAPKGPKGVASVLMPGERTRRRETNHPRRGLIGFHAADAPVSTTQPPFCLSRHSLSALMVAALLLAGCTSVGQDYRAPRMDLPQGWHTAPAGIRAAAGAERLRWWAQLGDPLLSALIGQALVANLDIKTAQAVLREARARQRLAEADLAPILGASAVVTRSLPAGGASSSLYRADLDASWEADIFGGIGRAIEAARADAMSAEARLKDIQVSIAAEVALNYVGLRTLQRRLAIARANLASQSETMQLADWRVQAGLASSVELEQARSNREQTAAQIPALETARAQTAYALAVLLGESPGALDARLATQTADLPEIPQELVIGIPADTIRQRPDLRAAEAKLMAETARTGVAIADLYPALRLSGSLGVEALSLGALGGPDTLVRSLAAGVTGTLFDGGRLRARVEVQEAVQEQALVAYRASVLSALAEVENALVELENSRLRQQSLVRATAAASIAAQLAGERYRGGLIDFQTVLDTERTQRLLQDSLANAEGDRVTALVRLYKALGGGWPDAAQGGQEE